MDNTSKKKVVNNPNCCVYGCHSRGSKNQNITFHSFPKTGAGKVKIMNKFNILEEVDKRLAWILKIRTGKQVTKHTKICSLHFTNEDYILPAVPSQRRRLKSAAVPSTNLPRAIAAQYTKRTRRYDERKSFCEEINVGLDSIPCEKPAPIHSEEEIEAAQALLDLVLQRQTTPESKEMTDAQVQVKSGDIFLSFISLVDTDAKLNTLTGIPSFDVLKSIEVAYKTHFPDKKVNKLNIRERIILSFIKMKQNFSFSVISILFRTLTPVSCSKIFKDMVEKLYFLLNVCITWPEKTEIMNNMPICFEEFQDTRVILDCTEIPLQKPKCLCCRIKTYSHYKGQNTIKFLVGVSPGGLITFVSRAYGGRTSDSIILEQSNLLQKLIPYTDSIMIDKGFHINELAGSYGIKIICPPFLRKKLQFTAKEADLNRKIARARVHIERVFQRVKMFKIVKDQISWNIVPKIEKIFVILCAITNLRSSVLDDDKFLT